ncbi:MAG: glycosyltransferase [Ferruginibacter sp.]
MKKILWLASWYPNRKDPSDGDFIQRQAKAVALHLPVHVFFLTKAEKPISRPYETTLRQEGNLTEQIVYYRAPLQGASFLNKLLSRLQYRRVYKKLIGEWVAQNGLPALVHLHVAAPAGAIALWMQKKWGTKFILTEHWTGYYPASKPGFYDQHFLVQRMCRQVLKKAVLVLPVSKDLGETIRNNFVPVEYEVVPNVVDTSAFFPAIVQQEPFRFLHVSYLNYQKNPEGIIAAAAALYQRGFHFELIMLGRQDAALEQEARDAGLPETVIQFRPAVPYTTVALEMQQAHAFVLFSRFENLPCVLLEALCCGLPVISSRVGGIPELVNERNGMLVASEDVGALTNAMQEMITQYTRYDRSRIAAAAAGAFNYETAGRRLLELYQRPGL